MTIGHEWNGERLFSVEIGGVDGACLFWVGDSGGFLIVFPLSPLNIPMKIRKSGHGVSISTPPLSLIHI